jgi:hypothetical protein
MTTGAGGAGAKLDCEFIQIAQIDIEGVGRESWGGCKKGASPEVVNGGPERRRNIRRFLGIFILL